jgi:hypothetical protein
LLWVYPPGDPLCYPGVSSTRWFKYHSWRRLGSAHTCWLTVPGLLWRVPPSGGRVAGLLRVSSCCWIPRALHNPSTLQPRWALAKAFCETPTGQYVPSGGNRLPVGTLAAEDTQGNPQELGCGAGTTSVVQELQRGWNLTQPPLLSH